MNEEHTLSLEELGEIKKVKVYNQAYVDKQQKRIVELQAQIEKMKCCQNCKHCTESVSYKARDGKEKSKICSYGNYCCNKWEIK